MDALERKVEVLTGENTDYKKKIENLEENNASLLSQLQKLQALVARSSTGSTTGTSSRIVRHMDTTAFTSVSSCENALKCAASDTLPLSQPYLHLLLATPPFYICQWRKYLQSISYFIFIFSRTRIKIAFLNEYYTYPILVKYCSIILVRAVA
jgi:hypothetical protein